MSANNQEKPFAIYMVGNAHLDPAWMWQWGEGMEAFLATCRSAVDRLEETPEFIFTCSSAAHYRWVEEVEPGLFRQIQRYVQENRWCIVGGWWVQADCNIPGGEGFVRQALLGQRYFMRAFGKRAITGYSPDAFGHTLGLPQLLKLAGMSGYIFCRPDPKELTLPAPIILWRGPDGSEILAYRVPFHYNMYETTVSKKVSDLETAFSAASNLAGEKIELSSFGTDWSLFYGVGNHGGGPTREHISEILRINNEATAPSLIFSGPDRFFASISTRSTEFPLWTDDLQVDAPGCYSVHSQIKKLNRQSEHLLMRAEKLASIAAMVTGSVYPQNEFTRAWENVCFNHFHDIICGVAIKEALEDAAEMYGEALAIAKRETRYAVQRLSRAINTSSAGQSLIVFNTHSFDTEEPINFELWHDIDKSLWGQPVDIRIIDGLGMEILCQDSRTSGKIGKDRVAATFISRIPALGWRTFRVHYGERQQELGAGEMKWNNAFIENARLRVQFDEISGAITSIFNKESQREFLSAPAFPIVILDETDTWGHGVEKFDNVIGRFECAEVMAVDSGPVYATIRVKSRWGNSWLQQEYTLHARSRNIHVQARVFWGEEHTMLKLEFPIALSNATAISENAYCTTSRECDGIERPCGSWVAIVGNDNNSPYGFAVANDCKHSFSAQQVSDGIAYQMTVLRSPTYATHDPHPYDSNEDHDFIDQGIQEFSYILIPFSGTLQEQAVWQSAALLNAPLIVHLESGHSSGQEKQLEWEYRGLSISASTITATVLKRHEDGNSWIVRLYENAGKTTSARINVHLLQQEWEATFRPHQLRTYLVNRTEVREVDIVEMEPGTGANAPHS